MPPPASLETGSSLPGHALLLPGLPWCVVIGALVSLLPIALFGEPLLVLVHLPTFGVLLGCAADLTRRAREGQSRLPVAIAAVVGGSIASVSLMLLPWSFVWMDREFGSIYWFTWLVLPIVGLVASALAAGLAVAVVGIAWVVSRLMSST